MNPMDTIKRLQRKSITFKDAVPCVELPWKIRTAERKPIDNGSSCCFSIHQHVMKRGIGASQQHSTARLDEPAVAPGGNASSVAECRLTA